MTPFFQFHPLYLVSISLVLTGLLIYSLQSVPMSSRKRWECLTISFCCYWLWLNYIGGCCYCWVWLSHFDRCWWCSCFCCCNWCCCSWCCRCCWSIYSCVWRFMSTHSLLNYIIKIQIKMHIENCAFTQDHKDA